jgi:hypothetical protein
MVVIISNRDGAPRSSVLPTDPPTQIIVKG